MLDNVSNGIIEILKQKEVYTAQQLGRIFSVSEKTIRNRIKELNTQIIENGALIVSERGAGKAGFHLDIINEKEFENWLDLQREEKTPIPNTSEERVSYLIDYLLNQKDYVLIDDLCELIYVSHNTLSSDLRKAEQLFHKYDLKIDRRPNYGIKVIGKEVDKRSCIIDYFSKNYQYSLDKMKKEAMLMEISDVLSAQFHKNRFATSVDNYLVMKNMIYVAYTRKLLGFAIVYEKSEKESLKRKLPKKAERITNSLISDLGKDFSILDDEDEKLYICLQIAGRGNINEEGSNDPDIDIDRLVNAMLKDLYEGLKVDLRDDLDLMLSLKRHMQALDIRLRYHIRIDNPILEMVRKQYSFAYALASYSCSFLCEFYDLAIPEEEIGFIAIIYALALEQKLKPIRKKNVVIVCAAGSSSSRFFMHKYKETYGEYLDQVYECSAKEIEDFDFKGKKIDLCFTTLDIDLSVPVPVYKISMFPSDSEIKKTRSILSDIGKDELDEYYQKRLFIPHLKCSDKEEAIDAMIEVIRKHHEVPENFKELVMQRERYGLTSFGSLAATPHPAKICTKENIVCVAILDEAIDWGSNDVQVIILLSLSDDEKKDVSGFIQTTTDLISDETRLKKLIEEQTFEKLMELLKKKDEIS